MREIKQHRVNPANEKLMVYQRGEFDHTPVYTIELPGSWTQNFQFQNGPVDAGFVNGITIETVLSICIDRLQQFQAGDNPCEENNEAIASCMNALEALQARTQRLMDEGEDAAAQHAAEVNELAQVPTPEPVEENKGDDSGRASS